MAGSIQGGTFFSDHSGKEYAYTVSRGKPAHLLGYDLKRNKLVTNIPLDKEIGSWDLEISSDGWLYVAGNTGHVYKHKPGSEQIEDLGKFSNEALVFDLATGTQGEIFGGTYNHSLVFRYHPAIGFKDVGNGPMITGEQYVRSLVYRPKTGRLYAGVGAHAGLIELDPKTGTKKEILPEGFRDYAFVYNMSLATGFSDGDKLFAWLQTDDKHHTLMYDLETGKVIEKSGLIQVRSVIKDRISENIFYLAGGKLFSEDLNKTDKPKLLATFGDSLIADVMWGKDKKLYMLSCDNRILKYDPVTARSWAANMDIPPQPIKIQSLAAGPDGRIWTGGYLTGGHAAYNPKTGKIKQYPGLHQTEGMTVWGQYIYMGVYPAARMYVYDTKQRWQPEKGNPRLIKQINGQDRPFAGVDVPGAGRMFFGTVPRYGALGGTLLGYNIGKDSMSTYHNVIPNQSIVSLVYAGGIVYGGSTVRGGMGILPSEKEAKFFGWDWSTSSKVFEVVPIPGGRAVTCLINGPDGNVWGIADGVLFIFDPIKKAIIKRQSLYPIQQGKEGVYFDAKLIVHPSGTVYGTGGGNLFKISSEDMKYEEIRKGARLLTMDKDGTIYTVINETLWQYKP